ncbi:Dephospho-CoA kinase cab5 [Basidiobolus ranarum]|uniref:Dephospho-CoA kinase cab5 n=1 Tax=Basidiobolus ranarum TaxID=34480 RepID=A0ABR2WKS0_9FUNG
MKVVGLTGGAASGKSSVAKIIRQEGYPVLDIDKLLHLTPTNPSKASTLFRWFFRILSLIKKYSQAKVNTTLGPNDLRRILLKWVLWKYITGYRMVFVKSRLLYEQGLSRFVSAVIMVYCTKEVMIQRLMERDGCHENLAVLRAEPNGWIEKKRQMADYVIHNSDSFRNTESQVLLVLDKLRPSWTSSIIPLLVPTIMATTVLGFWIKSRQL